MHRHRLALLLLILVACGDDDGGEPFCPAGSHFDGDVCVLDEDAGPGGDMGPCGDCADEVCDEVTLSCVACLRDTDCTDGDRCDTDLADPSMNRCVACTSDAHCTDPAAAKCDTAAGTCTACDDSTQCEGTGQNVCSDGACVQCSEDTAETHCGANSCDPATGECTDTPRGSLDACVSCVSDTECADEHFCVPTRYGDDEFGSFCLKDLSTTCERPFSSPISGRVTASGRTGGTYCGVSEAHTTCDAVRALVRDDTCAGDDECPEGGICRQVAGLSGRCTYLCTTASQCTESGTPGALCDSALAPADDDRNYCGGAAS